ncbi:MAG: NAD(+) diphosphatase [Cryobacterium sp.]|nr:NAD(+) diphosphatase [Cryobacterium sp.]
MEPADRLAGWSALPSDAPTASLSTMLSRSAVDRDHVSRSRDDLFAQLLSDPATRILPVWNGRALCIPGDVTSLRLLSPAEAPRADTLLYLGRSMSRECREPVGTPIVAVVLSDAEALALASDEDWLGLRDLGAVLGDRDAGLLVESVALANWHETHRFSPRTGKPLVSEQGGWVLRAADDTAEVFPRTDPAIIVAVTDSDDRLLLGSNALWQNNRYSLLAGFVEPGESLEAAVAREIFEESGVRVVDPIYLGSQPWPFPASLMVGFRALADPRGDWNMAPDGTEIVDLRWFTRDELQSDPGLILPGPTSIARVIIDRWLGAA